MRFFTNFNEILPLEAHRSEFDEKVPSSLIRSQNYRTITFVNSWICYEIMDSTYSGMQI
jgi:hypothetical protein